MVSPTPSSPPPVLTDRYAPVLRGVISCFDRILVQGTLPDIAHARAMTRSLNGHEIRIFDFPRWAQPLRERIRSHAEGVAEEHGITIEFIRNIEAFRKEDRVQAIVAERGTHPGLVHSFSAMALAPVRKTIYSLGILREMLGAATRRYLELLSTLDDTTEGRERLQQLARPVQDQNRSYEGPDFFDPLDAEILLAITRGELNLRWSLSGVASMLELRLAERHNRDDCARVWSPLQRPVLTLASPC